MTRSLLALAIVLGAGCGTDTSTDPPGECSAGETMACSCSPTSTGTMTCGADGNFGTCGQCSMPDPDPVKANFQAQIVPIFNKSCGAADAGCHARNQFAATKPMDCRGWLSLENASIGSKYYGGTMSGQPTGCPDMPLYQRLMQLAVWQCSNGTTTYIKPSDPARSYIMDKINGTNLCDAGGGVPLSDQVMPPPQPENPNPYRLSAADKALIQQWITEGALDN